MQAYLQYTLPNGARLNGISDLSGRASVDANQTGLWAVEGRRTGYVTGNAVWATLPEVTPGVAVATTTSIMLPLLLAMLIIRSWLRRRKGVVASEGVVRRLSSSGVLDMYSPVAVTVGTYDKFLDGGVVDFLKPVPLSDKEMVKSESLALKFDISPEIAVLLMIAGKVKAEKVILEAEITLKTYHLTRIVSVWEELQERPI